MSASVEHASDQTLQLPLASLTREPAAGDLLVGRYRLVAPIGAGGMARVFHARDERLRRDVALKVQRAEAASAPLREERAASAVFHPNVVAVFDGGQLPDDGPGAGASFIVMEYVPGTTAHATAPADCARAVEIVCQAAAGLAAAHASGVIHNDIKPSNILLDTHGRVKLADFGAAATTQTAVGDYVHGSPAYIAPERLRGARPEPRQDIYGLGGVLAYLITGQHPPRDMPPALPATCPAALADVIRRARAHDPSARYADAAAFRQAVLDATARELPARTEDAATINDTQRATQIRPARRLTPRARPAPTAWLSARAMALAAAWALALLLLVGGGLIAPRVISRDAGAPVAAGTSMPALTGMSFAEALDACAKQGIHVERVDVVYGPGPLNQVVDQTPAPGQALRKGDTVSLVVRTGR